ncbi:hypothetical protein AM501_30175 [Aneurinibacillus migulanus]|uniref:hypothetical protein n=1 Tax=Aneurinibacillus migulanus TaxID=47500 RepID=UPI0005BD83BF|nr:hypothetical protein [Aneurinibacillus migulanus]KIV53246.1 hypothetical protein TS64_19880 [Aneurinibacillus migulanus]KPD04758.1 hypothetical protein AM501_30175 [Aneurinibacillus migulanus]CEH30787.1 Uncharacterized protein BN1090_A2_03245 [Aneurinibacillus migulanus]
MKANRLKRKSFKKTILAATVVIGGSTLLFQGLIQVVTAAEFKKTDMIPTSYVNYTASSSKAAQKSLSAGYKKANYTVKAIDSQKPTSKDMTKEAAAEIGAQALWEIFGQSLEGQVIEMGYQKPIDSLPRSKWYADVHINDKLSYYFAVDSVTGEIFCISSKRWFDEKVPDFDEELNNNPQEYVAEAKKLAEKYNVVHSPVKSVEYQAQSNGPNNDPVMGIQIMGENGEIANMYLSRKDKALIEITYNSEMKYTQEHGTKLMQEHPALKTNQK